MEPWDGEGTPALLWFISSFSGGASGQWIFVERMKAASRRRAHIQPRNIYQRLRRAWGRVQDRAGSRAPQGLPLSPASKSCLFDTTEQPRRTMMEAQAKSRLAGIQRRVRAALIRIRRSTTKKERFLLTRGGTIQAGLMEKGDPGSARSSRREQGGEGEMGTQINRNRIGGKKEASFSLPPASRFSPSLCSWQQSGSCDVFPLMQWDWIPSGRVLLLGLPSGKKGER